MSHALQSPSCRFSTVGRQAFVTGVSAFLVACSGGGLHDDMDAPLTKVPAQNLPSAVTTTVPQPIVVNGMDGPAFPNSVLRQQSLNIRKAPVGADGLRVHALNIGAGTCVLVECPGSDDILMYDCGSMKATESDLDRDEAKAYVDRIVGSTEPIVVMSHAHIDHVNLIPYVLGTRRAKSVWFGGRDTDYGKADSPSADLGEWLNRQKDAGVPIFHRFDKRFNNSGQPMEALACGNAESYILTANAPAPRGASDNLRMHANSLILLIRYGEFKVVLTGDAVGIAEDAALDSYRALLSDTTVLFASHHGSKSERSNSAEWVATTRPSIVIYSADTIKRYGHPKGVVVERYREVGSLSRAQPHAIWFDPEDEDSPQESTDLAEYVTELNGAIVITSDGSSELRVQCSKDTTCW